VIAARKNLWFRRWFASHVAGRFGARFESLRVRGLDHLRTALAQGPVVVVSNHVTWWDPMLVLYLTERVVPCDSYALMDAANLTRLPFLGLIGGIGVDLTSASDGAVVMRYLARFLANTPGRLVWIFPQGRERPQSERPLGFRAGSAEVARVARALTLPVALRYEFMRTERPHLWIDMGAPIAPERDTSRARDRHEAEVSAALDRIEHALCTDDTALYEVIMQRPYDRVGAWAERMLAWATRARETSRPPTLPGR
jgi:1-acyl-sn-glycerol-3-phosphate acyltransferase